MPEDTLELTFIDVDVRDLGVERELERIAAAAKRTSAQSGRAVSSGVTEPLKTAAQQAGQTGSSLSDLDRRIDNLSKSVRGTRASFQAGFIGEQQFREETSKLKNELAGLNRTGNLTTAQNLKVAQAARVAESGLANLRGEGVRLGIAQNVNIGVAQKLEAQLASYGPLGIVAGAGLNKVAVASSKAATATAAAGAAGAVAAPGISAAGAASTGAAVGFSSAALAATALGGALLVAVPAVAVAGLIRFGDRAAEVADQIDKNAAKTGLGIEAYQEFAYWADQNGIKQEQLRQGLGDLNTRVGQAVSGNETYAASFEALGVRLTDTNGVTRDTEAILVDVVAGLENTREGAERTAAAGKIFGEEFSRTVQPALKNGAAGLEELRQKARDAGLILSGDAVISLVQYKDEMATLRQQISTTGVELTASFIPILTNGVIPLLQNTLVPALQSAAGWFNENLEELRAFGTEAEQAQSRFLPVVTELLRIQGGAQIVSASLDIMNLKFQLAGAKANQGLREAVAAFKGFFSSLDDKVLGFLGLGGATVTNQIAPVDTSQVEALEATLLAANTKLEEGFVKFNSAPEAARAFLTEIGADLRQGARTLGEGAGRETADGFKAGLGNALSTRTIGDVFTDVEQTGILAERRALALGDTLDARLESAKTRASALGRALDEALELGASQAQIDYLSNRLTEVNEEVRRLTPVKIPLPEVTTETAKPVAIAGSVYDPSTGTYKTVLEPTVTTLAPVQIAGTRYDPSTGTYKTVLEVTAELTGAGRITLARERFGEDQRAQSQAALPAAAQLGAGLPNPFDPNGLAAQTVELSGLVQRRVRAEQEAAEAQEAGAEVVKGYFFRAGIALAQGVDTLVSTAEDAERRRNELNARLEAQTTLAGQTALARARITSDQGISSSDRKFGFAAGTGDIGPDFYETQVDAAVKSAEEQRRAAAQAASAQQQAADQFALTVVGAAGQVGNILVGAISGQLGAGGIISGLGGAASSIVSTFSPLAGAITGVASSLLGGVIGLFGGSGRRIGEDERRSERQRQVTSVPAININVSVSQSNQYNGGPSQPETEQAFRRQAAVLVEEIVNRSGIITRLNALEKAVLS